MKAAELEPKYIVYSVELRKIKDGRVHPNMWLWTIKLWLSAKLRLRLSKLTKDYKKGLLSKEEYESYQSIIKSAIK